MKNLFVVLLLIIPLSAQAQEWTTEQMEVWNRIVSCQQLEDVDAYLACHHKDYVGWWSDDPVPIHFSNETKKLFFESAKKQGRLNQLNELKPLHIMIHGNVAIVHYMLMETISRFDEPLEVNWINWTDILLKEGGQWYWIADHGGIAQ